MLSQRLTRIDFLTALVCCMILTWTLSQTSFGQEAETLQQLQQKWTEIDAKLAAKENELKFAEGDTEQLQTEFKALVDEANTLVKKLESTAKSKLESDPEDSEAVRTLMGVMLNDAQFNRDANVLELGDLLIANGVNPEYFNIASRSERLSIPAREIFDELIIRHAEAMKGDLPRVKLSTTQGDVVIELYENEAPNTVGNFISLIEQGYYTDMIFHRVIEGFMAQGGGFKMEGDAEVGGEGPGYEIKCECDSPEKRLHFTNCLSMAHRGKDTGGSQFFLTFSRTSFLDGEHTCFGRVIEGQDVLKKLARTHVSRPDGEEPIPGVTKDKIVSAEVLRKRDHAYVPDKVVPADPEDNKNQESPTKTPENDAADQKSDEDGNSNESDEDQGQEKN